MKCPSCGTWYPEKKVFCLSCGEMLSEGNGQVRMGEYILLEKIGQGGIGVVFRAKHEKTDQEVAIKVLNQSCFGDVKHMQRFRREMRMHKKLEHPNIIEFIDIYEDGESLALVMECLSGCSLKDYINHRGVALPLAEIIHISASVLLALATAHENDVIHRDLKPSNIFITDDGEAKLMDFGLAKSTQNNEDITDSGITVGTYLYMAPEQILGQEISLATDLYAFGIVLYRMSTSVLPFMSTGAGEFEIMEKQARQKPLNPKKLNPEIPDALAALIMRLLEKSAADRPKSCAEVGACISALGDSVKPSMETSEHGAKKTSFADLNDGIESIETSSSEEEDTSATISYNTLLAAFKVDSPEAPEEPPFDMRRPPALHKQTLNHLKTAIANIPPLPEIWHQVQAIFDDPESSPAQLGKVIAQDAVLTAYILKVCNSAAYTVSGSQQVTDVAIALTRIGMTGAQTLILSAVSPDFGPSFKSSTAVRRVWFHGQAIALFTRTLAEYGMVVDHHSASMFGLLHDIGKLVILHIEPDEQLERVAKQIESGQDSLSAELEVLGYSHIDAGMMLALHWKLPRKVHRFIYYHHFPCWQQPTSWPPDMQASIMLVHMAHLALSALLLAKENGKQHEASKDTIWLHAFRTHVKGSESILYKPLHLPMKDAALYSQLRIQLERLQISFPDLYPDA